VITCASFPGRLSTEKHGEALFGGDCLRWYRGLFCRHDHERDLITSLHRGETLVVAERLPELLGVPGLRTEEAVLILPMGRRRARAEESEVVADRASEDTNRFTPVSECLGAGLFGEIEDFSHVLRRATSGLGDGWGGQSAE
jgi:hypothetical protein